jgi:hypothetical protein
MDRKNGTGNETFPGGEFQFQGKIKDNQYDSQMQKDIDQMGFKRRKAEQMIFQIKGQGCQGDVSVIDGLPENIADVIPGKAVNAGIGNKMPVVIPV